MTTAASTQTQRTAAEKDTTERVCRCEQPQLRTRASSKWATWSECAACGGLAPLKMH